MGSDTGNENKLSDTDNIRLQTRFVLPVIVNAMLSGDEDLDDVAEYAIHQIFEELYPDTAILCLALCAQHIAKHTGHLIISKALGLEADFIIQDYGPQWLSGGNVKDLSSQLAHDEMLDKLHNLPEDLESLADLLEATLAALDDNHAIPAVLCDILSQQARSHQDDAEILLEDLTSKPDLPEEMVTIPDTDLPDNVIPFPLSATKH